MYRLLILTLLAAIFILEISSEHRTNGAKVRERRYPDPCSSLKCEHFCIMKKGKPAKCVCHRGYKLQNNGFSCEEINECKENSSLCGNGTCHNIGGSYFCSCKYGYYFDRPAGTCKDVNECSVSSKICGSGECINKPGLYECKCYEGYQFNQRTWYCEAQIYECEDKVHSCRVNSLCSDLFGNFSCKTVKCPNAYYVRKNLNSCKLQCPSYDAECEKIKTKSIKWLSRSYKGSIATNQTQFVYWYLSDRQDSLKSNKKFILTGNDGRDFKAQDLHHKFIRIFNLKPIKGPKSYQLQLDIDSVEKKAEIRRSYILHISVSK